MTNIGSVVNDANFRFLTGVVVGVDAIELASCLWPTLSAMLSTLTRRVPASAKNGDAT